MKKKIQIYFPIRTENHLISCLNIVRRELSCKGHFDLNEIKMLINKENYNVFTIPKKSGGLRLISSPSSELAFLQLCIAKLMAKKYVPNENVYGFITGKSITDNAKKHLGNEIIFHTDIKDFFDSINFELIVEKLIRQPYYFSYKVAVLIASIVTKPQGSGNRVLPQGAPSSPIFTNIVFDHLDVRLSKFSEYHDLVYSRYADDIKFSFKKFLFFNWDNGKTGYKYKIIDIIKSEGFKINDRKTRIAYKNQRHEVTGIIVNEKINLQRNFIKTLRTELHNWEKDGYIIASYKLFKHRERKFSQKQMSSMFKIIEGKIAYLKMVKGKNDSTYIKMQERFHSLLIRDNAFIKNEGKAFEPDNIFNTPRYKKKEIYSYNPLYPEYNDDLTWKFVRKRNFTNQEISLIESGIIVPSKFGCSVKFTLKDGRIKFIPISNSSEKGVGENIDKNLDKVIVLKRRNHYIFRIEGLLK